MRKPTLDQPRTFLEVVERGSFSAAARRLNLTQPAVSLQIRELKCDEIRLSWNGSGGRPPRPALMSAEARRRASADMSGAR
jgi:hypothetical protein